MDIVIWIIVGLLPAVVAVAGAARAGRDAAELDAAFRPQWEENAVAPDHREAVPFGAGS